MEENGEHWDYDPENDPNEPMTLRQKFMEYFDIDELDYQDLGSNELRRMWWNFKKFGPNHPT